MAVVPVLEKYLLSRHALFNEASNHMRAVVFAKLFAERTSIPNRALKFDVRRGL
jgi:hypothetical protein